MRVEAPRTRRAGWCAAPGAAPRGARTPAAYAALIGLLLIAVASGACSSPEARAARHRARAAALLAEPEGVQSVREAALELRNAVALAPSDPESKMLLGRTLLRLGVVEEAIAYLEEAHTLAPEDADVQVELARALFFSEPSRSSELAAGVLEREPDHLGALLVGAEAHALLGDYERALARLVEAEEVAPDHADVEWARARVYEAKIRALRLKPGRSVFDPRDFQAAVAAYDAYIAKGGDQPSTVLLSRAKLYSIWPGHVREAIDSFVAAADAGDASTAEPALDALARYARVIGDGPTRLLALERLTALDPTRVDRWDERARVTRDLGRPVAPVLEAMLEAAGDDARAHVVYARYLKDEAGLSAAVDHLRSRIDSTDDDALLLAQLVQLQTRGGRPRDGEQTLAELQRKHPDDIQTRLLLARRALLADDPAQAIAIIEPTADGSGQRDALRVWGRATEATGDLSGALAIVERAIAGSDDFDASLWAWKAELLWKLGQPEAALVALRRLDWGDELTAEQTLLRARCEYDLGRRVAGRQRLIGLLEEPEPSLEAVLEFYRRERDHPPSRPLAQQALVDAVLRAPGRIDLLEALTDLDVAMGQDAVALQRVSMILVQRPKDPRLYALRAKLQLALGNAREARDDAERALILQPGRGDDALTVLLALSEGPATRDAALAALEPQAQRDDFPLHRKVVLGRLLVSAGRIDDGFALLEEARIEGAEYTTLKSDLARLLVLRGGDLDLAERLAREAVDAPGEQVAAADALGSVYMAKGLHDAAMWQYRFAAEHAKPPNADYEHHLGQALEAMQRTDAARSAYERALEIDPEHPGSKAALGALGGAAPATHAGPS